MNAKACLFLTFSRLTYQTDLDENWLGRSLKPRDERREQDSSTTSEEEEEDEFSQMEEIFSQVQLCPFKKRVKACTIPYEPGYTNKGEYNIAMYEDKNLVENLEKEMKKLQPFYQQIHVYVRKKLMHYYPNVTILPDGPIPAHLLGNMYAQSWVDIYPMVVPYPKHKAIPDITDAMIKKV
ncbi:Angiotensin-converting enzyme [Araneus ventricosus]|uniref:Angiotensin-converting enzyme n=1 Tax=Araneus ventricosus TaxID=182803 RepID=A0A4Y2J6L1_ARAVE|nr:Angiotensin-converting enzyme [Araneus ventricosus]